MKEEIFLFPSRYFFSSKFDSNGQNGMIRQIKDKGFDSNGQEISNSLISLVT